MLRLRLGELEEETDAAGCSWSDNSYASKECKTEVNKWLRLGVSNVLGEAARDRGDAAAEDAAEYPPACFVARRLAKLSSNSSSSSSLSWR